MRVSVIYQAPIKPAMLALGLSYGLTSDKTLRDMTDDIKLFGRLYDVAERLSANPASGEAKYLEMMSVILDIRAPRYWWAEMATYRVGVTTLSESTMHTLTRRELTQADFEEEIAQVELDVVNQAIRAKDKRRAKMQLPEGFLQRRIVATNYKALRHIIDQRRTHELPEWRTFYKAVLSGLEYPELIQPKEAK